MRPALALFDVRILEALLMLLWQCTDQLLLLLPVAMLMRVRLRRWRILLPLLLLLRLRPLARRLVGKLERASPCDLHSLIVAESQRLEHARHRASHVQRVRRRRGGRDAGGGAGGRGGRCASGDGYDGRGWSNGDRCEQIERVALDVIVKVRDSVSACAGKME
jgi:hypothetical protein